VPGGEEVVGGLFAAPGEIPLRASLAHSAMRTSSLYPFATWTRLLMLLALLAAFVVVSNVVRAPAQKERLFWVVTLVGLAISLLGMVQRLQWNGKIYWFYPAGGDASPFGPFFNYNHFAAYLEMTIPLALGMFLARLADISDRGYPAEAAVPAAGSPRDTGLPESAPPRRSSFFAALLRRGPDPLARLGLSGFAAVVMLAALLLAGSRGAILSLSAAIAIYGGVMASRRQMARLEWLAGLLVLAAALGFSAWIGGGRLSEVARRVESVARFRTEPSLSGRVVAWAYTLRIVGDYPLIGSGLGTFPEAWTHYYPAGTASVWKEAHNDYLQVAAEMGIAGFLIFAWGLWIFLRRYLFRRRAMREDPLPGTPPGGAPGDIYVRHGLAVGILAVLLHSWVDFSLQVGAVALLFVVVSAIMVGDTLRHTEA
jgi:O-antigen ligase